MPENLMVLQSNSKSGGAVSGGVFTHAEILQQPDVWPTTLAIVRESAARSSFDGPVILTGAGTSAYAASAIAASWPHGQAIPTTDLLIASREEIERKSPGFSDTGLLLSLGRSGDSPESVAVVNRMKRLCPRVQHVAITCNSAGELARTAGVRAIVLDPRTNDRSLAMTSSFSNLVLAGLCLRHQEELAHLLPGVCAAVKQALPEMDARAKQLADGAPQRVVILASGELAALAHETSLKILEMTAGRVVTMAETFLGLRHGPMSFLREDTLVLCFLSSSSERRRYEEDLLGELRQKRLGRLVGVAPLNVDTGLFEECIPANAGQSNDGLRVPFEIPFAQLLAFHLSVKQGLNPDSPSPEGAITRVVQKFVIHDDSADV